MDETAAEPQQARGLSEEHRAALTKYTQIDLRAHGAGVVARELGESRREVRTELQRAREYVDEIRQHYSERRTELVQSGNALLREVGRSELKRFAKAADGAGRENAERQLHRAMAHVESLELKLALIDAEKERADATARPLQETRNALRQHLINEGMLHEQTPW